MQMNKIFIFSIHFMYIPVFLFMDMAVIEDMLLDFKKIKFNFIENILVLNII